MKKIIVVFVALLSLTAVAQEELKEGVLTMKMNMSTDNEQAKAAFAMIGDITVTTFFKGEKSRTEQKHQMIGDNTSVVDNESKKILVLMDNPMAGKKYMESEINITKEDLENITVTPKNDSKTIAGYACKGYDVVVKKDGVESKMEMYTTEKIKAAIRNTSELGGKIKGFPMYMVMNVNQNGIDMKITMEVTEVKNEKVDDSKFDMTIPDGYSKATPPKPASID